MLVGAMCVVCGVVMFLVGACILCVNVATNLLRHLSVLQSYWNLHVWNRKEALYLSSVWRYLELPIVFTNDFEFAALLSSVGCVGTFLVSVVTGRTRLPFNLLRLPGVLFWCESQSASRESISEWTP